MLLVQRNGFGRACLVLHAVQLTANTFTSRNPSTSLPPALTTTMVTTCPSLQVAITIGASQALYVSFQAILSPGDEVVLLEPFFDLYLGQIRMAGGVPKQVPLSVVDGEWRLDAEALRR